MALPKSMRTVTPLSKTIALALFIALPIVAFLFGAKWQAIRDMAIITELSQKMTIEESQKILAPQNYDGKDDNVIKVNGTPIPFGL